MEIYTLTEFNEEYDILLQISSTNKEKLLDLMKSRYNISIKSLQKKYKTKENLGELCPSSAFIDCAEDTIIWKVTKNDLIN